MASGAAIAGTLSYGFINDNGTVVAGDPVTPTFGTATFTRVQNSSNSTIDLTAVMTTKTGTQFRTTTTSPNEIVDARVASAGSSLTANVGASILLACTR